MGFQRTRTIFGSLECLDPSDRVVSAVKVGEFSAVLATVQRQRALFGKVIEGRELADFKLPFAIRRASYGCRREYVKFFCHAMPIIAAFLESQT